MRLADRVESGWATMWIVALVVEALLCIRIAGDIRERAQARQASAREDAAMRQLVDAIRRHDAERKCVCADRPRR